MAASADVDPDILPIVPLAHLTSVLFAYQHTQKIRASLLSWKNIVIAIFLTLFELYHTRASLEKPKPEELHQNVRRWKSRDCERSYLMNQNCHETCATEIANAAQRVFWKARLLGPCSVQGNFTCSVRCLLGVRRLGVKCSNIAMIYTPPDAHSLCAVVGTVNSAHLSIVHHTTVSME